MNCVNKFLSLVFLNSFKKVLLISSICVVFLIPLTSNAQTFPKQPEPWRDAYNISLQGFEFSHPMTVLNQDELEIIKQGISSNIEPQKTASEQLLSNAAIQLSFEPDAPSSMEIMGGYEPYSNLGEMRAWLWRNCHAAYTCALAYAMTDDPIYAEKAKEVLMDWANMNTTFTGGDRGLQLGSWFSPMLYSADLIYNYSGWTSADKITFKNWWRNNCLIHTIDVMRRKDNNWKDAGLLGVLSAAVVLEDTLLLKEGLIQLKSYFFSRTDDYVRNSGPGWKIKKDYNGIYLPREVVRNNGSSGLTYTAYALTTMTQCLEIARYSGFNFWYDLTEEGATIKELIEQYYKWDIYNDSFPWYASPQKTSKRRNCYELANIHFELDENMKVWIQNNRPLRGREGDEYITLNKGDLFGVSKLNLAAALLPEPANRATGVRQDVVLSWTPGKYAPPINGHKVYLSEKFNDVNDGVGGIMQDANSYAPPQRLNLSTTYYWRVDEVNAPPDYTVYEGNVWSFTTELFAYPIDGNNITATASSSHQADMGPENTINGSGMDANDLHSNQPTDMWISSNEPLGAWIEFQFDKVYKLHQMWVWNSNEIMEPVIGFGVKDVTIEHSTNGTDYITLGTTHEFSRAPGAAGYAHNTTIDFGGVPAKYVRLTANSNWGGFMPQYGLGEVRFFHIPVYARAPYPDFGSTDVAVDVTLGWRAGREAITHDVYLSTDEQAVIDSTAPVTTVSPASYGPLSLDFGTTYYWRVDEVNYAEAHTTWQGDIWSFTTYAIGDFETGDFSGFNWILSGNTNWTVTSQERHSGTYSAQAGSIDDDQSTTLQVTLECVSGNITFYRKVSSESRFDYLRFYIDGVEKGKWSGREDWAEVSLPVTAGTRTFEWTYSKDSSNSYGDDTAWIDDIMFPVE